MFSGHFLSVIYKNGCKILLKKLAKYWKVSYHGINRKVNISITNVGLLLHRPENKKECYSHGNKRKSIIYPFHRSEDHANGGCDGGFIAYGVYFNRKCKGFGYSQQCQREFYFEPYGISGKNIGQDSGRGRFFHPVCSCHAGYAHGGCVVCLWISCRF